MKFKSILCSSIIGIGAICFIIFTGCQKIEMTDKNSVKESSFIDNEEGEFVNSMTDLIDTEVPQIYEDKTFNIFDVGTGNGMTGWGSYRALDSSDWTKGDIIKFTGTWTNSDAELGLDLWNSSNKSIAKSTRITSNGTTTLTVPETGTYRLYISMGNGTVTDGSFTLSY